MDSLMQREDSNKKHELQLAIDTVHERRADRKTTVGDSLVVALAARVVSEPRYPSPIDYDLSPLFP
jgi:hypothetical protein